jgi:hypothetical protein
MIALTPWPIRMPIAAGVAPIDPVWERWFSALVVAVNRLPVQVGSVPLASSTAAIPTTAIALPSPLGDGRYRVTYYLTETVAASMSSSATVTIGWTDGGVAQTHTFAALTTNTVGANQSNSLILHADAASTITYGVAYASV